MSNPPEIVGFYSITADDKYEETLSSLRYYVKPELPIDLYDRSDELQSISDEEEHMGHILRFILNHKEELWNKAETTQSDYKLIPSTQYITYKGILRQIMRSKISHFPWAIKATKYKGNIYLCDYISQEAKEEIPNRSQTLKRILSYGPMFKLHCLSVHPNKTPDMSNRGNAFFCVLKRNLVNRQILFATKMDGTDSSTPLDGQNFREWKLNQFIGLSMNCELNTYKRQEKFEEFKIPDMWVTSFMAGIEKCHIGFRNNTGMLKDIRSYSIDELETLTKQNCKKSMDGFEFLGDFFNKVETDLKDIDCPYTCIIYEFDEKTKMMSSTKHEGKTEYSSIPEWYLQEINKETSFD